MLVVCRALVVAEPEAVGRGRSGEGRACASLGGGSASLLLLAGESVAEAPGLSAGVDDVRAVSEAVDDGLGEPWVVEDLRPLAERQVRRDDQRPALVAFGEHLEDELGGALGQRQVAKLVKDDKLGARVAADDAGELAAALGLLQL